MVPKFPKFMSLTHSSLQALDLTTRIYLTALDGVLSVCQAPSHRDRQGSPCADSVVGWDGWGWGQGKNRTLTREGWKPRTCRGRRRVSLRPERA